MKAKINYAISWVVIQLALGYLVLFQLPDWIVLYVENVPAKVTLLIIALFLVGHFFVLGFVYLFPPAAITRTNMSWLICAWGAMSGLPATTGIYLINELELFGRNVLKISFVELGAASFVVIGTAVLGMYFFNKEYNRLLEPRNVGWSSRTPTIT